MFFNREKAMKMLGSEPTQLMIILRTQKDYISMINFLKSLGYKTTKHIMPHHVNVYTVIKDPLDITKPLEIGLGGITVWGSLANTATILYRNHTIFKEDIKELSEMHQNNENGD